MQNDFEKQYLSHHGILGQKWGIRRYQNPDGSLTEEGKKRYTRSDGKVSAHAIVDPKSGKSVDGFKSKDFDNEVVKNYKKYNMKKASAELSEIQEIEDTEERSKAITDFVKSAISGKSDKTDGQYFAIKNSINLPEDIEYSITDGRGSDISKADAANYIINELLTRSDKHLEHHGILGQKWGVRRYQNRDGSLTAAGRRHLKRVEKKDAKWAKKNYDKIYKQTFRKSKEELNNYLENDLNKRQRMRNSDGSLSLNYVNEYNRKLAEVMNKNVGDLPAPSGKVVQYVAKRGQVGVHMALVDPDRFDMASVRRGIYGDGRVAYKQDKIQRV